MYYSPVLLTGAWSFKKIAEFVVSKKAAKH
jgi:hypothetical protein